MKWWSRVKNLKHWIIAVWAYWYYGRPGRKLVVIGVTGTKGKSTTCRLVASVLGAGGDKVGMLSTVEFQIGDEIIPNDKKMSMLGLGQTQKMLKKMAAAGCRYAVVETSSEGILQYRHVGLCYDIAVFTNLGREHSERHGGYENLKRDKGRLFAALNAKRKIINGQVIPKVIVANLDDAEAPYYLHFTADKKIGYGLKEKVEEYRNIEYRHGKEVVPTSSGVDFVVDNYPYHLNIIGEFNVPNALAAISVGTAVGMSGEDMARGLNAVKLVAGRMEFVDEGQPYRVVVDYAHEPLSLSALFKSLRQIIPSSGRIIAVIGSDGGGRDVGKRPLMGKVTGELADVVVITDVNCFDEDPKVIALMLAAGAKEAGKVEGDNLFVETDRRKAILLACQMAKVGDVVAITAKGTEPWIAVANGQKIPWDDRQVARECIMEAK